MKLRTAPNVISPAIVHARSAAPVRMALAHALLLLALLAAGLAILSSEAAAGDYYTPQKGSRERGLIMDAARVPVSAEIGQTVIFVVSVLRTDGDWAYLQAEPRNPDGSPIDWYLTRFAEDWRNDAMSDVIMVLMKRSGDHFQVVDHVIGPTDVFWYGWLDRYGLPEALFHGG